MAEIHSTRLRFIRALSAEALCDAVSSLPFKVEIKGGPVLDGKRWVIFFVLPEVPGVDLSSGNAGAL